MITFNIIITNNNQEFGSFAHTTSMYAFLLQRTGQILDFGSHLSQKDNTITIAVACPEKTSLDSSNNTQHINEIIEEIESKSQSKIKFVETGFEAQHSLYKLPEKSSYYILRADFRYNAPLICGDTSMGVPLYKIPYTDFDEMTYDNLNFWEKDYKSIFGRRITRVFLGFG